MNKQFYTESGQPANLSKPVRGKDGKWELNAKALTDEQIKDRLGLFAYVPPKPKPGEVPGKIVFDKAKGTCTRQCRYLSDDEIKAQHEADLRAQFEAERQADDEARFHAWMEKRRGEKLN